MEKALELLKKETNPEVFIEYMKMVMAHTERVENQNEEMRIELEEIRKLEREQLQFEYNDRLVALKKIIFERGQEKQKTKDRPFLPDYKSDLEREVLLHSESLLPPPEAAEKKRKLLTESRTHELTDEEKKVILSEYGITQGEVKAIPGFFDESKEITVIEKKYVTITHKRQKYRVEATDQNADNEKQIIVTAKGPTKLLDGAKYSIDFAIDVVIDKYLYHMPLERQVREMESLGLSVAPRTLYSLCEVVTIYLTQVQERLKKEILNANLTVHCDETTWPIMNGHDDNGYFWVLSNQAGSYYCFEPTRSGKIIKECLKDYKGSVLCDGYTGYNRLKKEMKDIAVAHCWAHSRRKFIECEENYPIEAKEILDLMNEIFAIEYRARTFEELLELRTNESKKWITLLRSALFRLKVESRPQSALRTAVNYTLKYWDGLTQFLTDPKIPLTNNEAERAIRHAVMGRKNFQGSRSINGADVTATLYTIIESCKKVELDPKSYLKYAVMECAEGGTPLTPFQLASSQRPNVTKAA